MSTNNQVQDYLPQNPLNPRVNELLSQWEVIPLEPNPLPPPPKPSHEFLLTPPYPYSHVSARLSAQLPGRLPQRSSQRDAPPVLRPKPRSNPVLSTTGTAHVDSRAAIMRLEQAMREREHLFPVECEWRHFFAPGIYMREITMPKGALMTGRVHKHEHLSMITRGKVAAQTQDGIVVIEVRPGDHPYVFISPAGLKRALVVIEECTWAVIHQNPSNTQNLVALEAELTADSFEGYETFLLEHK
jgi:hypothetical protein